MLDINRLMAAYELISKNKGANTPGVDSSTLDGINMEWFRETISALRDHSYRFNPIRRVHIPKPDGGHRPLGIPSPRDKVVLKAMETILTEIFEPTFCNSSHGFRPNRGCHSCLHSIKYGWNGTKWFIEGDISKYFDTIDQHVLASIIMEKVQDKEFIDLYWKAVRASYVSFPTETWEKGLEGVPQGSTLSPVLSNIYLHKLDLFMEQKMKESNDSGPVSLENPKYKEIHTKISNLRQMFLPNYRWNTTIGPEERKSRLLEIKALEIERARMYSKMPGPGYRIKYVRYADDFLIGVNGDKDLCMQLKEEISLFLSQELRLTLNSEKTKITSATTGRAKFLGCEIRVTKSRTRDQPRSRRNLGHRISKKRVPVGNIMLLAPLETLVNKLKNQGICRVVDFRQRKIIPTRKTAWRNLELVDIVSKYGSVWRGILNYYSFADNRSQLNLIQFILHHSCACTIGDKQRLRSRAKVFRKWGKTLEVEKGIKFPLFKTLSKINHFSHRKVMVKPFEIFKWALRTKSKLGMGCAICGTLENVEMHHRRPLKGYDGTLKGIEKAQSRKQIPLCRKCHMMVHSGKYDGPGIY